ncbi:sugar phosphate isomerase/epimerase family protein [Corynebacterium gallinarum]|uniref:Sugar phosphate isomerase/epimerase n=1 Tax=Corynebacterium gallinarum TaxID=2762214 RepID=A0A8I0LBQ1_9CORY|nr:TIM barrel protein [Corynebacterium gallinarum]MBD8031127.1 sugar phosphate isomerase/epimerase [Corynebacterium gallinarum]
MIRNIGLAPLSALTTPSDELIRMAANAGFSFVGLRVLAVTPDEPHYDLAPGSPLLNRTLRALDETGLHVVDTEFLQVNAHTDRDTWLPALEAAGALGATRFTVAAGDENLSRLTDTLGSLVADAAEFGVIPALEPITYRSVHSIPQAVAIAEATGVRVLADTLHMARFGATLDELHMAADFIDMIQLCDSPLQAPAETEGLIYESRAARLAPGDGEQPLADFVAALPEDTLISVEVPNDAELTLRGPQNWINHLYNTTRAMLEQPALIPVGGRK